MQVSTIDGFRVSPQQRHLWTLLAHPDNEPYRVQGAVFIEGNLNVNLLKQAIEQVVQRNEALHTTFQRLPGMGMPLQVVSESAVQFVQEQLAVSADQPQQVQETIEKLIDQVGQHAFDLERGPLVYALLTSLALDRYILVISMPALCGDSVTLVNFLQEITWFYEHVTPTASDDPATQYIEFSDWQNALLEADEEQLSSGRQFWNRHNYAMLGSMRLPYERQSDAVFAPSVASQQLDPETMNQIEKLAAEHNCRLPDFLLVCWAILMFRVLQQRELMIGVSFDGRNYDELQRTFGLMAKFLPLQMSLEDTMRLDEVIAQVNDALSQMADHQEDFAWEAYVPETQAVPNASGFPVSFAYLQYPSTLFAKGVSFTLRAHRVYHDHFKVMLSCVKAPERLLAQLHYDSHAISAEDISRLADRYEVLLKSILQHPHMNIGQLAILADTEKQQLIAEFRGPLTEFPQSTCLYHLFEDQVQRTPNEIAVDCKDQKLTYSELNVAANRLAWYLKAQGVGPEVLVGLYLERSLDMLIALLGIMKAGGAYVPLDPQQPQERLSRMLADAKPPILLSQRGLAAGLSLAGHLVINLDEIGDALAELSNDNLTISQTPDSLAYVLYTSGSTGQPKGVLIPHCGLVNYLVWSTDAYQVFHGRGAPVYSSISFDLPLTGLFAPLLCGRTVYLVPPGSGSDGLHQAIHNDTPFSLIKITPAHLESLGHAISAPTAKLATNAFVIGGENLLAQNVAFWREHAPDVALFNEYGPTETVVGCCTYRVDDSTPSSGAIPIGRPIANTYLYLLDRYLVPVPLGSTGELYIGGVNLARGYLNRPAQTAERFIPDPFSQEPGQRLYRTGDLARRLADGSLEFVGRVDRQVKVQGYRLELGEIEATLAQHPAVRACIVEVSQKEHSNRQLLAYVVLNEESTRPSIRELRDFARERIPEYMVPSSYIVLESLPLTLNGKLDRRALLDARMHESGTPENYVAPHTELEQKLVDIWTGVLDRDGIGVEDNFFELGGHSLLVTQLILRIRADLQVQLPPRVIFEAPTITSLAHVIEATGPGTLNDDFIAMDSQDLAKEATLDPSVYATGAAPDKLEEPSSILVTGATGFLGAFLVRELLDQTPATVYCLVRARSEQEGESRLARSFGYYGLWDEKHRTRVKPIVGDLSVPGLGLSEEEFLMLASTVQEIFHCGAQVNFMYPYRDLKAANVLGTHEILRLASLGHTKPVHYISTLAVFSSVFSASNSPGPTVIYEDEDLDKYVQGLTIGYAQSKWVAEKLVTLAQDKGIPVRIYRPGRITGESHTGAWSPQDFLFRMIKGCIQLGCAPDVHEVFNMTPVDFASKAIIHLSKQRQFGWGQAFHVVNPQATSVPELVDWIGLCGYRIPLVPYEEWQQVLTLATERSTDNALYPLLPYFPPEGVDEVLDVRFDCKNSQIALADTSITCPRTDAELLATYMAFFRRTGLIDAPEQIESVRK